MDPTRHSAPLLRRHPVVSPAEELLVGPFPGLKLRRECAPLTAGGQGVEDAVDGVPQVVRMRAPAGPLCAGQRGTPEIPLRVGEIGRIGHANTIADPLSWIPNGLLETTIRRLELI